RYTPSTPIIGILIPKPPEIVYPFHHNSGRLIPGPDGWSFSKMTVRFGLLGAGRIGKVHASAVTANSKARLVAVADAMAEAATALADQYGAEVRSIDAILSASDIDAVVICTPTDTHADLIERFARAGKAVFCEKPIDLDVE